MIIVLRNGSDRLRGFLSSSLIEIDSGVYLTNLESPRIRDKLWTVIEDWLEGDGSAVMVFFDKSVPGRLAVRTVGLPHISLKVVDGLVLSFKK